MQLPQADQLRQLRWDIPYIRSINRTNHVIRLKMGKSLVFHGFVFDIDGYVYLMLSMLPPLAAAVIGLRSVIKCLSMP